jgi:putative peptidoglycan lipid II flippase
VNITLASFLIEGSIAYLDYAWLILMAPLGVFAMGLSTAIFPTLAEQSAESRREEEQQTFLFGFRLILYMTIPAAVGLIVLGRQIVGVLLERGAFDPNAAVATAFALGLFAIGLPGHAVIEIVDRVFYAERDTRTPVAVAAGAVALNIGLSLVLMRTGLTFGGLALANALAALTEAAILSALLHRRTGWMRKREMFSFGWRISIAALSMGIVAVLLQAIISHFFTPESSLGHAVVVLVVAACSAIAYFGSSISLGIDDGRRALQLFRRS